MNIVGHVAVAVRERDVPPVEFLVGAVLPDVAAMHRTKVRDATGALADGVAFHHACDAAFHDLDWFRDRMYELRGLLVDDLPRGAARACAHAGVELLLDGVLMDDADVDAAVTDVFGRLAAPEPAMIDAAPDADRAAWRTHLERVGTHLQPQRYRDPAWVATRLHAITARRPLLAFDEEGVEVVAAALARVQPTIRSSGDDVVRRVQARVLSRAQP